MNRIDKAIIMAAGKGERLKPLTLKTPKPLIKVNGICMIETIIEGLHQNGIEMIYVVVGYLKDQFYYLKDKYNGIRLIENPWYDSCNNISSLYCARDHLENAMILDGDQIVVNPDVLFPSFEKSGYSVVWTNDYTDEWMLQTENEIVTSCSRCGGKMGWQLFSLSRWNAEDGRRLKKHLEIEFIQRNNHQIYWDDVAMFCYFNEYELGIYKMQQGDLLEIDNMNELVAFDSSYKEFCNEEFSKE